MKTLNIKGLEREKIIYHSSKITHARWQAKRPSILMEHSLGGAAFRKELGGLQQKAHLERAWSQDCTTTGCSALVLPSRSSEACQVSECEVGCCYGLDVFSKGCCNWELEVIDSLGRWVLGGKCSGNFENCQGRQITGGPLVTLSRNYYIEGCMPHPPSFCSGSRWDCFYTYSHHMCYHLPCLAKANPIECLILDFELLKL